MWGGVFAGTPFKGRLFASEWPVLVWASAADYDRLQQSLRIVGLVYVFGGRLAVYVCLRLPLYPGPKKKFPTVVLVKLKYHNFTKFIESIN